MPDLTGWKLNSVSLHTPAKVVIVGFLLIYIIYSLLVVRQISIMNKVLTTVDARGIGFLGLLQLILATIVLILVIVFF